MSKGREPKVFGYARVSTIKQSITRQIDNIKSAYPNAIVIEESYTGTKMDRPKWSNLEKELQEGDTVIFDEVSRMSRNAEEGFALYKKLFQKGVNLVFLKEPHISTDTYKSAMSRQIELTGSDEDLIFEGINKYLLRLAEKQIKLAFAQAQKEVDFLHKRTSEGVRRAQAEGKQVGIEKGRKLTTKKSIETKKLIRKYSKIFNGTLNDTEVMKLTGLSRNTFYKYKKELIEEGNE